MKRITLLVIVFMFAFTPLHLSASIASTFINSFTFAYFVTTNNISWLPLYEFEGYALLAYDNFTPIILQYKNVYESLGKSYGFDVKSILKYVEGTDVYNDVLRALKNINKVVVEVSCERNAGDNISIIREENILRIVLPGWTVCHRSVACITQSKRCNVCCY